MHMAAVALLQWQDTKLHARVAALLQHATTATTTKQDVYPWSFASSCG
jgi:hypothetical protein